VGVKPCFPLFYTLQVKYQISRAYPPCIAGYIAVIMGISEQVYER
jgi:hypothetical protein